MKPKTIITELVILVVIIIASLLIVWIAYGMLLGDLGVDVKLHDTYFIVPRSLIMIPFVFLVMLVYLIKEAFYRYKRTFQNFILLISIFLFNVQLLFCYKIAVRLSSLLSGWTIYPPLSVPPNSNLITRSGRSPFSGILGILFFTQIFFLVLLVIIAVITGRNWKTNTHEVKAQ